MFHQGLRQSSQTRFAANHQFSGSGYQPRLGLKQAKRPASLDGHPIGFLGDEDPSPRRDTSSG
jgi:hypothetical protein